MSALTSFRLFWPFVGAALVGEAVLCALIIQRIPYTEIDWVAYMQEVAGPLEHDDWDYTHLRGDTGPLVYPAGFVYVYMALYQLTGKGIDILLAQYVFAALYVALILLVLLVYRAAAAAAEVAGTMTAPGARRRVVEAKAMPLWALGLVCVSRRVHSIFVLRLFNDGVAMLLLFGAVLLFTRQRWRWGCLVYSAAVSIKMNIFLFAPGLLLLLLEANGLAGTVVCLTICAALQLALAVPFLAANPMGYLAGAFDLSRIFFHKWTVNWKFVPVEVFEAKPLGQALLLANVLTWAAFAWRWTRDKGPAGGLPAADRIVTVLFESNFVGIVFARTLHYQFYSWYFHTLPFLLWRTRLPVAVRLALLAVIEVCFNIYPATPESSMALQASHWVLLAALWMSPVPGLWGVVGRGGGLASVGKPKRS